MSEESFTTSRLTLRRFTSGDAPALHAILSDAEAMRFWSTPPHATLAQTEDFVARTIAACQAGEGDDFIVIHDGALAGKGLEIMWLQNPDDLFVLQMQGSGRIRLPDGSQAGIGQATQDSSVQSAVVNATAVTRGLVGRTVSDVERDLILDTLDHCLGNRTHAANILGISIRTLRNKLREYSDSGLTVPGHGEHRLAG